MGGCLAANNIVIGFTALDFFGPRIVEERTLGITSGSFTEVGAD
jgi:hypothetical protein